MTGAELARAGRGARARRRRRGAGRAVRGDRAAHPRARAHAGSSPTCGSRWPGPRSRAIPSSCSTGARTVVSAALCYFATRPEPARGEGRLPRYTWRDEYALLRERLDALGRALGGTYRVLVDENDHVDREAAVRAGIAFYGKNTMADHARHGSWVVLGTLVTDVEIEPSPPLELDCGGCRLCIDACPTGALDEPGVLDATKCLSYWTQAPAPIPDVYPRGARRIGLRLRHLSGRVPVEPRRREATPRRSRRRGRGPTVSLADWLDARRRTSSSPSSTASTFRGTTLAGCGGTRSIALGNIGSGSRRCRSSTSGPRATIPCSPTQPPGPRARIARASAMSAEPARRARARGAKPRGGARRDRRGLSAGRRRHGGGACSSSPVPAVAGLERLLADAARRIRSGSSGSMRAGSRATPPRRRRLRGARVRRRDRGRARRGRRPRPAAAGARQPRRERGRSLARGGERHRDGTTRRGIDRDRRRRRGRRDSRRTTSSASSSRVCGSPTRGRGSGLGLAVVRTIAHEHGGEVEVRVEPRSGCDVQARAAGRFRRGLRPSST